MGRLAMIPQIEGKNMKVPRQICAHGLPVTGRAEHAMEQNQRRLARPAEIAMKKGHDKLNGEPDLIRQAKAQKFLSAKNGATVAGLINSQGICSGRSEIARHVPTPEKDRNLSRQILSQSRRATVTALAKLVVRAIPLPAIPNAVPWSGLVRTWGRPRVTLTDSSKSIAFNGARPWS